MRRSLAAAGLVAAALAVPASPAHATGSCGAAPALVGATFDSVGPVDTTDWFRYEGVVGAQYLVTLTPGYLSEADLSVYDAACGFECASDQRQNFPDVCLVSAPTGVLNVQVRWAGGTPWDAPYVLTVSPVLPTFE